MHASRRVMLVAVAAVVALGRAGDRQPALAAAAEARPDWRGEFDQVCSRTQDAMALSADELRSLVARCDDLSPRIDELDESSRKVFTRRLQACRDLYRFVLESRETP